MSPLGSQIKKWSDDLYTRGRPVYLDRQTLAMTTLANTVTLTVPRNERWIIIGGLVHNASGADCSVYVYIFDSGGNRIDSLHNTSVTNGSSSKIGNTSAHGYNSNMAPLAVVYENQQIEIGFGAAAGKSGSSYWYLNILQFEDRGIS